VSAQGHIVPQAGRGFRNQGLNFFFSVYNGWSSTFHFLCLTIHRQRRKREQWNVIHQYSWATFSSICLLSVVAHELVDERFHLSFPLSLCVLSRPLSSYFFYIYLWIGRDNTQWEKRKRKVLTVNPRSGDLGSSLFELFLEPRSLTVN
jgi:hypothetical protein